MSRVTFTDSRGYHLALFAWKGIRLSIAAFTDVNGMVGLNMKIGCPPCLTTSKPQFSTHYAMYYVSMMRLMGITVLSTLVMNWVELWELWALLCIILYDPYQLASTCKVSSLHILQKFKSLDMVVPLILPTYLGSQTWRNDNLKYEIQCNHGGTNG